MLPQLESGKILDLGAGQKKHSLSSRAWGREGMEGRSMTSPWSMFEDRLAACLGAPCHFSASIK